MDPDTVKLIVSVAGIILAFAVSMFAEPVKLHFANRHEVLLLRKALYVEMAFMYDRMASLSRADLSNYTIEMFKQGLNIAGRFEAYEYAKSRPLLFAQLKDAPSINAIYANLRVYAEGFLVSNVQQYSAHAKQIFQMMTARLAVGDIDKQLFLESLEKEDAKALATTLSRYTPEMIHQILSKPSGS
jgi:hypothetical protein